MESPAMSSYEKTDSEAASEKSVELNEETTHGGGCCGLCGGNEEELQYDEEGNLLSSTVQLPSADSPTEADEINAGDQQDAAFAPESSRRSSLSSQLSRQASAMAQSSWFSCCGGAETTEEGAAMPRTLTDVPEGDEMIEGNDDAFSTEGRARKLTLDDPSKVADAGSMMEGREVDQKAPAIQRPKGRQCGCCGSRDADLDSETRFEESPSLRGSRKSDSQDVSVHATLSGEDAVLSEMQGARLDTLEGSKAMEGKSLDGDDIAAGSGKGAPCYGFCFCCNGELDTTLEVDTNNDSYLPGQEGCYLEKPGEAALGAEDLLLPTDGKELSIHATEEQTFPGRVAETTAEATRNTNEPSTKAKLLEEADQRVVEIKQEMASIQKEVEKTDDALAQKQNATTTNASVSTAFIPPPPPTPAPTGMKPGEKPIEEVKEEEVIAFQKNTAEDKYKLFKRKCPEATEEVLERWSSTLGCYLVFDAGARGYFYSVWSEKVLPSAIAFFNLGEGVPIPGAKVRTRERTALTSERGAPKKVLKSAFVSFCKLCAKYGGDFIIVPSKTWATDALGSVEIVFLCDDNHLEFCKKGTPPMSTRNAQAVAVVDNSFRLQGGRQRRNQKPSWEKSAFATTVRSIAGSAYSEIDSRQRLF